MYKYFRLLAILFISLMLFSACNITQTVHFNKDYSGDFKMVMDMSGLLDMSSEMGESEESMEGQISGMASEFDSAGIANEINSIQGVSGAYVSMSDIGEMIVEYHFEDVKALNRAMTEMGNAMQNNSGGLQDPASFFDNPEMPSEEELSEIQENAEPKPDQFVRKGKTIIYTASAGDNPMMEGLDMEGMDMEDEDALQMASAFLDYTVVFTSDRKFKNLEVTGGMDIVQQDNNSITMRMDLARLMKEKGYTVSMRLK